MRDTTKAKPAPKKTKKTSESPKPKPKSVSPAKPSSPTKSVKASPIKKTKVAKKVPDARYLVVRCVVYNILDNAAYVLDACKCKTVSAAHLNAVAMIQNTIAKNRIGSLPSSVKKTMMGGAQVMPSEFFGVDSGRYFDISQVQNLEANMFADAALSRAEMPLKVGGGDKKVTVAMVKEAIKDYNSKRTNKIKVSKNAVDMIHLSCEQNVSDVEKEIGVKPTIEAVRALASKDTHFAHLHRI